MTTIQINLPDELAVKVRSFSNNAEKFIIDLLSSKLNELDKSELLIEEYKLAAIENKQIKKDFAVVDLENWGDDY